MCIDKITNSMFPVCNIRFNFSILIDYFFFHYYQIQHKYVETNDKSLIKMFFLSYMDIKTRFLFNLQLQCLAMS